MRNYFIIHMKQVHKQGNMSSSEIYYIIMVVISYYLEREKNKILKFRFNNFSNFEISRSYF